MVVVLLLAVTACTSGSGSGALPASPPTSRTYELPFGLRPVEGTVAVGRPAVYDDTSSTFRGVPVPSRRLLAAYRVSRQDPTAAVRDWAEQLSTLPFDRIDVRAGEARIGQWLVVTATSPYQQDQPSGAFAQLQLWATSADPVLLIDVSVRQGAPTATAPSPSLPAVVRPAVEVDSDLAEARDVLFREQGQQIHVPDGAGGLMPTLPTPAGTGGSTSVLAAADGNAAVRALLDEAKATTDYEDVTGPTVTSLEGVSVVRAFFIIPAGGWTFSAVAVRGPEDDTATVYVTSGAD